MKTKETIKSITFWLTIINATLLVVLLFIAPALPMLITSPLLSTLLIISAISGSIWMGLIWNED